MNEKEIVNKWFEENMCVSFDKFIENWEEQKEFANYLEQENKQLKEKINGVYEERDYLYYKTSAESKYAIEELQQEKQHYKHIIDELEKWLEEEIKSWTEAINEERDYELVNEFALRIDMFEEVLNKLQELKGSDKE